MPTPAPVTRIPRARSWPSAGPSTRAGTPGPVVFRTAPTPTPRGRTLAPSSFASSMSTLPSRRPADRNPAGPYQNMRVVTDGRLLHDDVPGGGQVGDDP